MTALEERWRRVLDGMSEAERHASRPAGSVRLVAVSKFHPASDIAELCRLGQRDFGENYVQEARAKQQELADLDIRWHAIGAVQSNKAKDVGCPRGRCRMCSSRSISGRSRRRLA